MLVDGLIFELLTLDQDGISELILKLDTIANIKDVCWFFDGFRYFAKFLLGLEI